MGHKTPDLTQEHSPTTGLAGGFELTGAVDGYRTLLSAVGAGNTTSYVVRMGALWEMWHGTVEDGVPYPTVSRGTFVRSSSGGQISWPVGIKTIYVCDLEASRVAAAPSGVVDLTGKTLSGGGPHQISISGNAATATTATRLATARTISLTGEVTGSVSFNGSANVAIVASVVDDGHGHSFATIAGLQDALDGKLATTGTAAAATKLANARSISLTGIVTGSANFDGSGNIYIATTPSNDVVTLTGSQTLSNKNIENQTLQGSITGNNANGFILNLYGHLHGKSNTAGNIAVAGGASADEGANIVVYPYYHATLGGVGRGRVNTNEAWRWYVSGGRTYLQASDMFRVVSNSYLDGLVQSEGTYNNTTAAGANMVCSGIGPGRFYRSTSLRRFKDPIEDLEFERAINWVENAKPVWYRSLCDADNPTWGYYGYVAEDAEQVDPRVVSYRPVYGEVAEGEEPPLIGYTPDGFQYDRAVVLLQPVVRHNWRRGNDHDALIDALLTHAGLDRAAILAGA